MFLPGPLQRRFFPRGSRARPGAALAPGLRRGVERRQVSRGDLRAEVLMLRMLLPPMGGTTHTTTRSRSSWLESERAHRRRDSAGHRKPDCCDRTHLGRFATKAHSQTFETLEFG